METLTYLKKGLLYGNLELKESLERFKELGKAIDCPFVTAWALMELVEYLPGSSLPDYRFYQKVYNVNFKNGREKFRDFPVPYEAIHPNKKKAGRTFFNGSATGINQEFLLEDGGLFLPANKLKPKMRAFLNDLYGPDIKIVGVCEQVSAKLFRRIILASEEIMLNFLLGLETRFGHDPRVEVIRLFPDDLYNLFLEVMLRTGNASHLDLPVKYKPLDLEGFSDAIFDLFDDCEVPDEEWDEAIELLDNERESASPPGTLGIPVENLIERLADRYPKLGYKGSSLRKVIIGYYGFDKPEFGKAKRDL
ncbi:MAG: hypothetical protein WBJ10_03465 [Daejeonella sp.]|uniref:hypothetical protein n=1 Tax=Daejeonella sp. TaxID=2805397 RepID=UPI003C7574D5